MGNQNEPHPLPSTRTWPFWKSVSSSNKTYYWEVVATIEVNTDERWPAMELVVGANTTEGGRIYLSEWHRLESTYTSAATSGLPPLLLLLPTGITLVIMANARATERFSLLDIKTFHRIFSVLLTKISRIVHHRLVRESNGYHRIRAWTLISPDTSFHRRDT